jgi:hypothetical protein
MLLFSLKEVQGYKMLCVREILIGEAASGPQGPYPVVSWSVL